VLVLSIEAGLHVPLMPFVEVVGNEGIVSPTQKGPICIKSDISFGITVAVTGVLIPVSQSSLEAKTQKVVVEVSVVLYEFPVNNSVPPF